MPNGGLHGEQYGPPPSALCVVPTCELIGTQWLRVGTVNLLHTQILYESLFCDIHDVNHLPASGSRESYPARVRIRRK